MEPSYKFDQDYETPIIGVDEVGRGTLAGPVISAAIILNKEKIPDIWHLKMSRFVMNLTIAIVF